jgi:hypothetical protein
MPPSADLQVIKKKFGLTDGAGRTTESEFWSQWESLLATGFCWPLAAFVLSDGVGLQIHFQPGCEEFALFVETKNGPEFMRKLKEDWHAEN